MKIGVFDSGIGGLSVVRAIKSNLPGYDVIFRNDAEHVPYGNRSPEEILQFVIPIFSLLVESGCEMIVVACNTVSTTLILELRRRFSVPLIAMEPMIKPAVMLTKSKVIAVCATPTTLASARYAWLKATYATGVKVIEPDCSDWSFMIEHNQVDEAKIAKRIESALKNGADIIVLGCTHYHWIESNISAIAAKRAQVIQPEMAVIAQLKRVIAKLELPT